jgi:CRP/FNR family cyclic AMP-dependent transcriptional regulator
MPCNPEFLKDVPLFTLLDDEERAVLAAQVDLQTFAARQRIYQRGDASGRGYIVVSGKVRVTTVDEDHQEVLVEEPGAGDFFGFASMLDRLPHQTDAITSEETVCVEVDGNDILVLIQQKPHAGLDLLTATARQVHAAHELVRGRSARNSNEVIEGETTFGERIADAVARFGGSWTFIIIFGVILVIYSAINVGLGKSAWDPYPFILLNLFLSMLAAIQAPVIMMSQNRQDQKDRVRGELDFDVNRRAESEIQALAEKLHVLGHQIGDVQDLIRRESKHQESYRP